MYTMNVLLGPKPHLLLGEQWQNEVCYLTREPLPLILSLFVVLM